MSVDKNLYICFICKKNVKNNCIYCEICDQWLHFKCSKISRSQFISLSKSNGPFFCFNCLAQEIPFSSISNKEFKNLNVNNICTHSCDICNINNCYCKSIFPFSQISNTELFMINNSVSKNEFNYNIQTGPIVMGSQYSSTEDFESLLNNDFKGSLSFLHINIRSLNKNKSQLEELMSSYNIIPDIIGISETKINKKTNTNFLSITGYNFHSVDSMLNSGGVGVYIKDSIVYSIRQDLNFKSVSYESIWLEISVVVNCKNNKNILVGLIYRHPGTSIPDFSKKFSDFLLENVNNYKDICIFGDININYLNDKVASVKNYLNQINSFGLTNLIKVPTRINNSGGTLIDHFYCSTPEKVIHSHVLLSDISDHFPLYIKLKNCNLIKNKFKIKNRYFQDFSKINTKKLLTDASLIFSLHETNKLIQSKNSINTKFSNLIGKIKEITSKNVPSKKLSKAKLKLKTKPWITKAILKSIKQKNKMYKNLCKNNFNNLIKVHEYKKYRNKLTKIKTISKKAYYEKMLKTSDKNTSKIWKIINNLSNRKTQEEQFPNQLDINENSFTKPIDIVNNLNNYFANIGLQTGIKKSDAPNTPNKIKSISNSFFWLDVTEIEIFNIIKSLDSNKANGYDNISVKILKKINSHVCKVISELINQSYYESKYPDSLKLAKVIPIFKSGSKKLPGNYRPISILSNLNKIIEKVIYNRLYSFFTKNNILNSSQFGFREGHSTTMALSEFVEGVLKKFDKGEAVCAVLLDLSKAFDTVDRRILLNKLECYGIRGKMQSLIKSYLDQRKQFVNFSGYESTCEKIDVGVPQGSVLGPLLFLVHINDLQNNTNLKILNFADDTLLYRTFEKKTYLQDNENLNLELQKVSNWLKENKLKLNVDKTRTILFHPGKSVFWKNLNFEVKIGKTAVKMVKSYKYLGVIIDNNLNWTEHIEMVKSKLLKAIGVLYKTRYFLNENSLYLIFNSLFMSHIRYGLLCWGRTNKTKTNEINVLINKAIRCIHFKKYNESVSNLKITKKVLNVENLFKYELGVFMFKYINNFLPVNFNCYFKSINKVHSHSTRSSKTNFFLPRFNNKYGLQSLSYQGSKLWTELPINLKDQSHLVRFQAKLKDNLISDQLIK